LAKILTFPDYKNLFNEVLGSNYKVWAINFRRSSPNDLGLYLHQDGLGQVNLAILLDNNLKGYGSTAVLPGSHLIIHSIKKMKLEVPAIFINWFKFLFKPLSGERGDIAIFSNRTWHGRFSNNSDMSYDVILVGFFPERYAYNNPWPKDFIRSNQGTDFGKLLATSSDLIHANGISDCNSRELGIYYQSLNHGYSMLIENEAYLKSISHPLGLRLKLFFMIYLVKLVRFIRLATKNQLK
jgi:putative 2OG-Fe(II) oxygenase